jgi:hypothetical protein
MSIIGGDILEVSFTHPTLGSGTFRTKSDEDGEYDKGGFRSADEDKGVASDGTMIDTMSRNRWSVSCVIASDLVTNEDLEKLTQLAANPVPAVWTFQHVSLAVYRGSGKPVGDIKHQTKAATVQLKLSGGGELKKVA